jgi:two-component system, NtrC family, C4-dicarboxylate transport response regulator DctD
MVSAARWVLVVDDDDDNREIVVECLNEAGYQAKGVSGGAAALEVLRTERPSLVLSDFFMTGMNGKELLIRARREAVPLPPFVFVTGAAPSMLEDISGAFLYRPFNSDQLLAVVAHHCA